MKRLMALGILIVAIFTGMSAAQEITDWSELTDKALPAIVTVMSAGEEGAENTPLSSGFIISGDGKVVTSFNAIAGKRNLLVRRSDGSFLTVKGFIAADADKGLIILQAEGNNLPFISLGDSDKVKLGEAICVISSMPSAAGQISTGVVSAFRELKSGLKTLQITTPVTKESIGAPVFNKKAEIIGIASFCPLEGGQVVSIAIPSNVAKELLKGAKAEVQPLSGDSFAPFALATAQTELYKTYKEAIQTPQPGEDNLVIALLKIAEAMARAGQTDSALGTFSKAMDFSQKIGDKESQSWAVMEIAKSLARAGQFDKALQVAKGISISPHVDRPSYAMAEIGISMAKAGQLDQGLQVVQGVSDLLYRCYGLVGIAGVMVEAGQRERAKHIADQALQVAKSLKDKDERSGWIGEVARVMAKTGDFDKALQVAKGGDNKYLAWIAEEMAKDGQFDRALQTVKGTKDVSLRESALLNIIKEMAKAGQFDQAIKVSQEIKDPYKRCQGLSCVAAAMAMAGQQEPAEQIYTLALQTAQGIKAGYERNFSFSVVAQAFAQAKQFDKALQIAEGIVNENKSEQSGNYVFFLLAEAMASAGQYDQALQAAQRIADASVRSNTLSEVAMTMARAGQFDASLKVAQTIQDPLARLDALAGIINVIKAQKQQ